MKRFWKWIVAMVAQHCGCTQCYWSAHLKPRRPVVEGRRESKHSDHSVIPPIYFYPLCVLYTKLCHQMGDHTDRASEPYWNKVTCPGSPQHKLSLVKGWDRNLATLAQAWLSQQWAVAWTNLIKLQELIQLRSLKHSVYLSLPGTYWYQPSGRAKPRCMNVRGQCCPWSTLPVKPGHCLGQALGESLVPSSACPSSFDQFSAHTQSYVKKPKLPGSTPPKPTLAGLLATFCHPHK